mgnify:FL=1
MAAAIFFAVFSPLFVVLLMCLAIFYSWSRPLLVFPSLLLQLAQKVEVYNRANREVAILCNHQRSVPASHEAQMERIGDTVCGGR